VFSITSLTSFVWDVCEVILNLLPPPPPNTTE
jgi:hypothetical protein